MSELQAVHSSLGASSYKRWGNCPGSVKLSEGIEKTESEYAKEGTRAHEVAEIILNKRQPDYYVTDEMLDAVMVYVDYVENLRNKRPDFEFVEQKFNLSFLHKLLYGTSDYVCYYAETKTLYVVDYKHGAGVAVEVESNEQLMYYAAGALFTNKVPVEKVILTIVQPRCPHEDGVIREWSFDAIEILDFVADLVENAKKTEMENAPLKNGEWCRWCPAQAICPLLNKKSLAAAKNVFAPELPYDPEKLSEMLDILPQVESWVSAVREFAYREAEKGRVPPGYKMVDKRATRKWSPDFRVEKAAMALEIDESKFYGEPKPLSPAQMEKYLPKEKKELLEQFVVKESSGKNLVPLTDSRREVNSIDVMFSETV